MKPRVSRRKPTNLIELKKYSRKALCDKYITDKTFFDIKIINEIVHNQSSHVVAVFKEFMIIDDSNDFISKFFRYKESMIILAKLLSFYETCSKIFANYTVLKEAKYLYKNIQRKQKLIDNLQMNENDISRMDTDYIFNTQIYNSIMNVTNKIDEPNFKIMKLNMFNDKINKNTISEKLMVHLRKINKNSFDDIEGLIENIGKAEGDIDYKGTAINEKRDIVVKKKNINLEKLSIGIKSLVTTRNFNIGKKLENISVVKNGLTHRVEKGENKIKTFLKDLKENKLSMLKKFDSQTTRTRNKVEFIAINSNRVQSKASTNRPESTKKRESAINQLTKGNNFKLRLKESLKASSKNIFQKLKYPLQIKPSPNIVSHKQTSSLPNNTNLFRKLDIRAISKPVYSSRNNSSIKSTEINKLKVVPEAKAKSPLNKNSIRALIHNSLFKGDSLLETIKKKKSIEITKIRNKPITSRNTETPLYNSTLNITQSFKHINSGRMLTKSSVTNTLTSPTNYIK